MWLTIQLHRAVNHVYQQHFRAISESACISMNYIVSTAIWAETGARTQYRVQDKGERCKYSSLHINVLRMANK